MKNFFAILCFLPLIFARPVAALEIGYSSINPFDGSTSSVESILLKGEITPGDYEHLLELIRNDPNRFWNSDGFILSSPGGDVQEAVRIASFIKGTFSSVFVGRAAPCVSSCFFIFAAAAHRQGGGYDTLGVHRPYIDPRRMQSLTPRQAEALQNTVLRQARLYLENLQVPTSIIDKMFQRASTEVAWLTRPEIEEQLGARPPWYEQFLIARCGLDKAVERRYFQSNDKSLLDQIVKVDMCGRKLSRPDAQAFLTAALQGTAKERSNLRHNK
jgi:hypothetical protein